MTVSGAERAKDYPSLDCDSGKGPESMKKPLWCISGFDAVSATGRRKDLLGYVVSVSQNYAPASIQRTSLTPLRT